MMKRNLFLIVLLMLAMPAVAQDWDEAWNSAGELWYAPEHAGSHSNWAEWVVARVPIVDLGGMDFWVTHFAFPCASATGQETQWIAWVGDDPDPPSIPPESATWSGSFLPPVHEPGTPPPPFEYATIEVSQFVYGFYSQYLFFGYRNPGYAGLTDYNGVDTWGWIYGAWNDDGYFDRTAVLQVMGYAGIIPVEDSSLSRIKSLY